MDGILIINKPQGWTSHDVVLKLRKLLGEKKIGHTGTLDPMATGVLVLCIGRSVKLVRFLQDQEKEYLTDMVLGVATDTYDSDGKVVETKVCSASRQEVEEVLARFRGEIEQVPPMISAIKVRGEPLYRRARRGEKLERPPRRVTISRLELLSYRDGENPVAEISLRCSKGTYVRSLVSDIGEYLHCGAHVSKLVRTRAGNFSLKDSLTLEILESLAREGKVGGALISMEEGTSFLPGIWLRGEATARVKNGHPVTAGMLKEAAPGLKKNQTVRVLSEKGKLLAIGKVEGELVFGLKAHEVIVKLTRVI